MAKKDNDIVEELVELNQDLMKQFSEGIQNAIDLTMAKSELDDPRHELLTTLLFFAAHVANELSLTKESAMEIFSQLYSDPDILDPDEGIDILEEDIEDKKDDKFNIN